MQSGVKFPFASVQVRVTVLAMTAGLPMLLTPSAYLPEADLQRRLAVAEQIVRAPSRGVTSLTEMPVTAGNVRFRVG